MIRNSFIFVRCIGEKRERMLWENAILSWEDFLERERIIGIPSRKKPLIDLEIKEAKLNFDLGIPYFFAYRLPRREHWRLYGDFKHETCFLDIETTGLSPPEGEVTLVGVYDGREYRAYIKGINLSERALKRELGRYSLLVTFYGSAFDIPFLEACFPGINFNTPHLDLCFALRRLGLRGGLKRIEEELGLRREEVKGMDGMEAVRLWKRWEKSRDKDALEKLVEYNRADVENLKPLAEYAYSELRRRTFEKVVEALY